LAALERTVGSTRGAVGSTREQSRENEPRERGTSSHAKRGREREGGREGGREGERERGREGGGREAALDTPRARAITLYAKSHH
jgi:hypothetical protein